MSSLVEYTFEIRDSRSVIMCRIKVQAGNIRAAIVKAKRYMRNQGSNNLMFPLTSVQVGDDTMLVEVLVDSGKIDAAHIVAQTPVGDTAVSGDVTERRRELSTTPARIITVGLYQHDADLLEIGTAGYPIDWYHILVGADLYREDLRERVSQDYDLMIVRMSSATDANWRKNAMAINPPDGGRLMQTVHNGGGGVLYEDIRRWYIQFNREVEDRNGPQTPERD